MEDGISNKSFRLNITNKYGFINFKLDNISDFISGLMLKLKKN